MRPSITTCTNRGTHIHRLQYIILKTVKRIHEMILQLQNNNSNDNDDNNNDNINKNSNTN